MHIMATVVQEIWLAVMIQTDIDTPSNWWVYQWAGQDMQSRGQPPNGANSQREEHARGTYDNLVQSGWISRPLWPEVEMSWEASSDPYREIY
jgi:hypothetical protein